MAIEYRGVEYKNRAELARAFDIEPRTVTMRIKRGMTLPQALGHEGEIKRGKAAVIERQKSPESPLLHDILNMSLDTVVKTPPAIHSNYRDPKHFTYGRLLSAMNVERHEFHDEVRVSGWWNAITKLLGKVFPKPLINESNQALFAEVILPAQYETHEFDRNKSRFECETIAERIVLAEHLAEKASENAQARAKKQEQQRAKTLRVVDPSEQMSVDDLDY